MLKFNDDANIRRMADPNLIPRAVKYLKSDYVQRYLNDQEKKNFQTDMKIIRTFVYAYRKLNGIIPVTGMVSPECFCLMNGDDNNLLFGQLIRTLEREDNSWQELRVNGHKVRKDTLDEIKKMLNKYIVEKYHQLQDSKR